MELECKHYKQILSEEGYDNANNHSVQQKSISEHTVLSSFNAAPNNLVVSHCIEYFCSEESLVADLKVLNWYPVDMGFTLWLNLVGYTSGAEPSNSWGL